MKKLKLMYGERSPAEIQTIVDAMKKRKDRRMLIVLVILVAGILGVIIYEIVNSLAAIP
ncbi:MAG: hypothetical protein NWE89_12315 [Candidatus Bathyarchaeota archaeon]|nr:hypothetical protein [Candidatus Bathyarchaeota archaeon]